MLHALPVFFTQHLNRCQSNVAQFFAIFPPSARWVIFMRTFGASDHVHVPRHLVLTNCALCLCLFLFLLEVPSFTCMFWVAWIRVILVVVGCNKDSQTLVKMVKKRAFLFSVAVWQMKLYMNECHWLFLARGKKKKFCYGGEKIVARANDTWTAGFRDLVSWKSFSLFASHLTWSFFSCQRIRDTINGFPNFRHKWMNYGSHFCCSFEIVCEFLRFSDLRLSTCQNENFI